MCARVPLYLCLVLLSVSLARAQEPIEVDALVKKGAVRLTASEIKEQLVGAETQGPSRANLNSILVRTLKSDGSYEARSSGSGGGRGASIVGKWVIKDDGTLCTEGRLVTGNRQSTGACAHWYKLADQYYVVDTEDAGKIALPRTVKK